VWQSTIDQFCVRFTLLLTSYRAKFLLRDNAVTDQMQA